MMLPFLNVRYRRKYQEVFQITYLFVLFLTLFPSEGYANPDDRLSFSGFGRITAGYLSTSQATYIGYSERLSLKPETLVGLQASYALNPEVSATVQGIIRTQQAADDDVINWAYLSYQPGDNFLLKAGRLQTPFFLLSDVLNVGYAYPWISAPQQVYRSWLFPTYHGIDATWGHSSDMFDSSLEFYMGNYSGTHDSNYGETEYDVKIFGGVIARFDIDDLTFRISHHRGKATLNKFELNQLRALLEGAGYNKTAHAFNQMHLIDLEEAAISYETIDYFLRAEWTMINARQAYLIQDVQSYYISAGYNIQPVTLYVTFAQSNVRYRENAHEIPVTDRAAHQAIRTIKSKSQDNLTTWTFGARWDVHPQIALKAEMTVLEGKQGEQAFFHSIQDGFDRNANLYRVSLEWVF
ncbi:porin [Vibrio rhizosphaerae]|uniref:Porin n=1 Tax=Vibrio rhizosphaerae TaxID=398736 RepID=A0ABU4IYV7_9VIBR|nr:porin [Vibrio rhizosphaerae]MDW6094590.1 porin [Vibrio rhizosphaerae]